MKKFIIYLPLILFLINGFIKLNAQNPNKLELMELKNRDIFDVFYGDSLFKYFDTTKVLDTIIVPEAENHKELIIMKQNLTQSYFRIIAFFGDGTKYRETYRTIHARFGFDIIWKSDGHIDWVICKGMDSNFSSQIDWYDSITVSEISIQNDSLNKGFIIKFFPDGKIKEYTEFIPLSKNGCSVTGYYENGKLAYTVIYNLGQQLYTEYYKSGTKAREGYIINLDLIKVGTWKEWDENGKLIKTDKYPSQKLGLD